MRDPGVPAGLAGLVVPAAQGVPVGPVGCLVDAADPGALALRCRSSGCAGVVRWLPP